MTLCHAFFMRKLIPLLAVLLFSCAHQKTVSEKKTSTVSKKTRPVAASLAKRDFAKAQEFDREKKLILAAKQKTRGETSLPVVARPQTKRLELTLKPDAASKVSEARLLNELQDRYDMNDEIGFQSRYQALQARFPKSARMNEAHYMAGLLAISNKNYGRALKAFDRILARSSRGPEAPKALFAKAIAYKRMNLPEPSRGILRQIQARYPKTTEAQRAALELKIQEKVTR